jgi:multidrug efflux pump subunit AcrB
LIHAHPSHPALGASGRIAAWFQSAHLTPLLALVAFLLGVFAVLMTPREEEPQINVTMANLIVPFPGASVRDVANMITIPAEQVLSKMAGVEHIESASQPGVAMLTVQFKVGVSRTEALVRLHDTVRENSDWLPKNLGALEPLIKPKGIEDVPIVTLTLHRDDDPAQSYDLERIAVSIESEIKRVAGTRDVRTVGGSSRAVRVEMDAQRMVNHGVTVQELRAALQSANMGMPLGRVVQNDQAITVEAGAWLGKASDLEELVVQVSQGKPVYLKDVAQVQEGPLTPSRMIWTGSHRDGSPSQRQAVTVSITKKVGENAIDVANAVIERVDQLKGTVIPDDVQVLVTRNYGATANDKAQKLIQKLLFATASVVALVFLALGRREAAIVGTAVLLTLTVTLFASWAWGFTLNRVSLFALIFSIGILVDDAIVVVENIHRHMQLYPDRSLAAIIPHAVDEVGGPTILATLTVIAALLPMAFVSGLMGPYMSPIPINASMGMLLSLAIAFVVTPWLSRIWLKASGHATQEGRIQAGLRGFFERLFQPLLDAQRGARHRRKVWLGIGALIAMSMALPAAGLVVLKMLPFDNKSEFQVVVDMPAGTPLERTAAVLQDLGAYLATVPEVDNYQAYAGVASPINFNGLVRQYDLRRAAELGDIQVNLADKHHRSEKSHAIATRLRPELQRIGRLHGANVKVVEVPPGPPVRAPIVAEIYGPEATTRAELAKAVRAVFESTPGVVDVDDSSVVHAPKWLLQVDRAKAALLGVSQQAIVSTLMASLDGEDVTHLRDGSKYPAAVHLQLPAQRQGNLDDVLQLAVRSAAGRLVPIRELVKVVPSEIEQPIFHKDLLPVHFVTADMAGDIDSPLYGLFKMRERIQAIRSSTGESLGETFIRQPDDALRHYTLKWDGEWQITYETFRDMGAAYAVGLLLIYLLVVAQFGSYLTPLIIMAPIPLTLIGVMPGHALLGAQFTATSMIGMIALAGIIVRNSILLVDFINLQLQQRVPFDQAVVQSAITRAQPIVLTGLAAMLGAFFILDDPIFNGLAISLIFGILVSTLLTLVVIPLLYYVAYRHEYSASLSFTSKETP